MSQDKELNPVHTESGRNEAVYYNESTPGSRSGPESRERLEALRMSFWGHIHGTNLLCDGDSLSVLGH